MSAVPGAGKGAERLRRGNEPGRSGRAVGCGESLAHPGGPAANRICGARRGFLHAPRRRRFPLATTPLFGTDALSNPKRRRAGAPNPLRVAVFPF